MTSPRTLANLCRQATAELDQATAALTAGRLDDLPDTAGAPTPRLAQLLEQISDRLAELSTLSDDERQEILSALGQLRRASNRNGAALLGTIRGLRAGRARIDEWLSGPTSVAAYGANGAAPQPSVAVVRATKRV